MNDQEQPKPTDQPIIPEVIPTPATEIGPIKLEELPPEPLKALDEMVKMGYGSRKIKSELEKNFGTIEGLIPAARGTYDKYIEKHYERLDAEKKTENIILESVKLGTELLHQSSQEIKKGRPGSAQEKLDEIDRNFVSRIDILQNLQAKGNLSAHLEGILLNYYNSYRSFLQTRIEYEKEQQGENPNIFVRYVKRLKEEFLDKIIGVHQKVHGDDKVREFDTELATAINEVFEANMLEIHRETDDARDAEENNRKP